jgi:hypothetical protein
MKRKNKQCNKNGTRYNFNVSINQEDRNIIDELMDHGVNVSGIFKKFIRNYLQKIKKLQYENS